MHGRGSYRERRISYKVLATLKSDTTIVVQIVIEHRTFLKEVFGVDTVESAEIASAPGHVGNMPARSRSVVLLYGLATRCWATAVLDGPARASAVGRNLWSGRGLRGCGVGYAT